MSAHTRAHEGDISEVMAHDLRCTMPPLRASRPLACLPKGSLSQRPKCPPPLHLTPKFSCPLRAEEEELKEKGFHVHIYHPFHRSPQTFCTFLQGCPSQQSPSWLIKSSDWCCVPSLWPLCRGRVSQGKSLEGTGRNPGLDPGCVGSIRR